jgi:cobalamin biosynthesis Mg chelatase CobN
MFVGTRHRQAPARGLPSFVLMSVIALLALACFPVFAQAEDSAGTQYTDALPKPEGNNSPTKKKQPVAKTADGGGASVPSAKTSPGEEKEPEDGSGEKESSEEGAGAGAGKDGGTGQGSPGSSAKDAGKTAVQPNAQTTAPPASDDGSSPLVPILLVILVLAAISLAVVMIRQRRQRGPATPASEAS